MAELNFKGKDGTSIECDLVLMTDWQIRLPSFSAKVAGA